jgi:hypothetical protein
MLPFLGVIAIFGRTAIRDVLRRGRRAAAVVLAAALIAQAALYMLDMYTAYPPRAAPAFDTGVPQAITAAHRAAAGHTVYLSSNFEQPYIQAFFALLPRPPRQPVADAADPGLRRLGMVVLDPGVAEQTAATGDILVLGAGDPQPRDPVTVVDTEFAPQDPLAGNAKAVPLVYVYRVG